MQAACRRVKQSCNSIIYAGVAAAQRQTQFSSSQFCHMDFIFRRSDGSHVSVYTVHPSLLRSSPFSYPRWYHLKSFFRRSFGIICNDLTDLFNSHRLHHCRCSLKTVIHAHPLTIVPLRYCHLHIGHQIYRVPRYPGAGDLQTG